MSFYFAQIDENGKVIGISQLTQNVNDDNLILIEQYDSGLLNADYNRETGEFTLNPIIAPTPGPNPIDELRAENEDLKAQVQSINADFQAFMDFYFNGGTV
jgi:hypothetical protein